MVIHRTGGGNEAFSLAAGLIAASTVRVSVNEWPLRRNPLTLMDPCERPLTTHLGRSSVAAVGSGMGT
jgi:hypothetical protein